MLYRYSESEKKDICCMMIDERKKGLSFRAIAKKIGCSHQYVARVLQFVDDDQYREIPNTVIGNNGKKYKYKIKRKHHLLHKSVYFIQDQMTNMIKIGKSNNVSERLLSLNHVSPTNTLVLLCVIDGWSEEENALHNKFKKYRHHGEWFYPDKEILDHIENLKRSEHLSD